MGDRPDLDDRRECSSPAGVATSRPGHLRSEPEVFADGLPIEIVGLGDGWRWMPADPAV
jgi:hypothetical protein